MGEVIDINDQTVRGGGGPYRLELEIADNLKTPPTAKPSLGLLVSLYNRAFSPLAQE